MTFCVCLFGSFSVGFGFGCYTYFAAWFQMKYGEKVRAFLCAPYKLVTLWFAVYCFFFTCRWFRRSCFGLRAISSWSPDCLYMRVMSIGFYFTSLFISRRSNDKRSNKNEYCPFYLFRAKSIVMICVISLLAFEYRCVINWLKSHNFLVWKGFLFVCVCVFYFFFKWTLRNVILSIL